MTCAAALRVTLALALIATAAQAAPILPVDQDYACNQSVDSGLVSLSSTSNVVPVTQVTPVTHYQPLVQAHAAIVDSECQHRPLDIPYGPSNYAYDPSYGARFASNYGAYGNRYGANADLRYGAGYGAGYGANADSMYGAGYGVNADSRYGAGYGAGSGGDALGDMSSFAGGLRKRQNIVESGLEESSDASADATTSSLFYEPQGGACDTSIPPQTVDMGSNVHMIPSTSVNPATFYQPQVQSLESDIQACAAESSALPEQNVQLGSNVSIQPTTQVLPQTMYQPAVHQLTAEIDAAPQEDQSLPQSSVELGSSVQIVPTVSVTPLTVFQPSVQSLPFIIDVEPCVNYYDQQYQRGGIDQFLQGSLGLDQYQGGGGMDQFQQGGLGLDQYQGAAGSIGFGQQGGLAAGTSGWSEFADADVGMSQQADISGLSDYSCATPSWRAPLASGWRASTLGQIAPASRMI
ncbi:hypothetical protein BGZ75_003108 [Mortierella antarctica]|nr:hypothetical protein BGZ75_003108 [Mortierella antarctica]